MERLIEIGQGGRELISAGSHLPLEEHEKAQVLHLYPSCPGMCFFGGSEEVLSPVRTDVVGLCEIHDVK